MKNTIKKSYETLITYFVNAYKNTNDQSFKKEAQNIVKTNINKLNAIDPKTKDECINILLKVGLSEKDLNHVEIGKKETEYSEFTQYIENNINNNSNKYIKHEFNKLLKQLYKDMKQPNRLLIETWNNNYKDFVERYSLDKVIMLDYLKYLLNEKYNIREYIVTNKKTIESENKIKTENEPKYNIADTKEVQSLKIINIEKKEKNITNSFVISLVNVLPVSLSFNFLALIVHSIIILIKDEKYNIYDLNKLLNKYNLDIEEHEQFYYLIDKKTGQKKELNNIDKERYELIKNALIKISENKEVNKQKISLQYMRNNFLRKLKNNFNKKPEISKEKTKVLS